MKNAYQITATIGHKIIYMGTHETRQKGRAIATKYAKIYYPDQTPFIQVNLVQSK